MDVHRDRLMPPATGDAPQVVLALARHGTNARLDDLLGITGYRVVHVETRADVLAALRAEPGADLVIASDAPGELDGVELCRRIKNDPQICLTPVVLLVSSDRPGARVPAISAGADECLAVSFSADELLWRLRHLIEHKRVTDSLENAETVIFSLARAIEAKDAYTHGHVERVACYAAQLGRRLGLDSESVDVLQRSGIVHDLGKIVVPDEILNKPGKLTAEEFELIKRHPVVGYDLLEPLKTFATCLPCVRWHHERPNGTGYPDRLGGDEFPLLPRIMAVADFFDALTSARPYRVALSAEKAFAIMRDAAARGEADAELVEVLVASYPDEVVAGAAGHPPATACTV